MKFRGKCHVISGSTVFVFDCVFLFFIEGQKTMLIVGGGRGEILIVKEEWKKFTFVIRNWSFSLKHEN